MAISPIDSVVNSRAEQSASESNSTIDKNEFLLLFVTQLQNQDPLSPMENTELASQTAQFASLEQMQYINNNLNDLKDYQSAIFDENAVSFIGKTIKATDNAIELINGDPVNISFDLEKNAGSVYASIYNASGALVSEVMGGAMNAGSNSLTWDGTRSDGVTAATDGQYFVEIQAVDSSTVLTDGTASTFAGVPFSENVVEEVNFWNGTAYLTAGGREIAIGNVQKVSQ